MRKIATVAITLAVLAVPITAYASTGNAGDDFLRGTRSADVLFGGAGNDELRGRASSDYLNGEGGDDLIRGGIGADLIRGGPGADVCIVGFGDRVFGCETILSTGSVVHPIPPEGGE